MNELRLKSQLLDRITAHAERTWPEECCGVLIGRWIAAGNDREILTVEEMVEAENVAEDRRTFYSIAPETLLAAHKSVRGTPRDVVGYYHSHPRPPPRPSARDLEDALPGVSYQIVALDTGRVVETRSFRLAADGDGFDEENVTETP